MHGANKSGHARLIIAATLAVASEAAGAHAATLYVDPNGFNRLDCSNPLEPCRTIAWAVTVAQPGDSIYLVFGVHTVHDVVIAKDLSIFARSTKSAKAVLTADSMGRHFEVLAGHRLELFDVKLINGVSTADGGSILNEGTLYLSGAEFDNNRAEAPPPNGLQGGAIANFGTLTAHGCTFSNNSANIGGAIANGPGAELDILEGSALRGNAATTGSGGAIFLQASSGDVFIDSSNLSDNTAAFDGGAIHADPDVSRFTIAFSTLFGNAAAASGGAVRSKTVTAISNTHLWFNRANNGRGGALSASDAISVTVYQSTLAENAAQEQGGAIALQSAALTVVASAFSDNEADGGGAIHNSGVGSYQIDDSYFVSNTSLSEGGAIADEAGAGAPPSSIETSTFERNDALNGGALDRSSPAQASIVNSTFSGNAAVERGGTFRTSAASVNLFVSNATIVCDPIPRTTVMGAAIHARSAWMLVNSIVSGCRDMAGNACSGSPLSGAGNMVGLDIGERALHDRSCGSYPAFSSVAPVGVLPLTDDPLGRASGALPVVPMRVHPLQTKHVSGGVTVEQSNAVDAGHDACRQPDGIPLAVDQRALPRTAGLTCDVGAYELQ